MQESAQVRTLRNGGRKTCWFKLYSTIRITLDFWRNLSYVPIRKRKEQVQPVTIEAVGVECDEVHATTS